MDCINKGIGKGIQRNTFQRLLVVAGEAGDGALELTTEYVSDNAVVHFEILIPRFP